MAQITHLKIDGSELRVALEEPDAFMRAIGLDALILLSRIASPSSRWLILQP